MSGLVRSQASRDGAWQRLQLNAPPGNLLSLDLVRALGKALHDLESTPGIKWLTIEGAGVEFSFPLTPRREHVGSWLQLRGTERFSYGVQTVVGNGQTNNLTPWFGRFAPVPMGLADTVDNFDRGGQVYLDSNLHRVRRAFKDLPVADAP